MVLSITFANMISNNVSILWKALVPLFRHCKGGLYIVPLHESTPGVVLRWYFGSLYAWYIKCERLVLLSSTQILLSPFYIPNGIIALKRSSRFLYLFTKSWGHCVYFSFNQRQQWHVHWTWWGYVGDRDYWDNDYHIDLLAEKKLQSHIEDTGTTILQS